MKWKKNDVTTVRIIDIGISGEGIGKSEGYTLFVRDAVPGDLVRAALTKVKKQYAYARLLEVLTPSPDRVEPVCPAAGPCGGCQLQNLSYSAQCAWKAEKVKNDLIRIGGFEDPPMEPFVGMEDPFHYRNKAQFPVGYDRDGRLAAGFFASHSHRLIPLVTADGSPGTSRDQKEEIVCAIGQAVNNRILKTILKWMQLFRITPYDEEKHTGIVRHILIRSGYRTDEILVCLAVNADQLLHAEVLADMLEDLACGIVSISFSPNKKRTNVIMGESITVIRGDAYMTDRIGKISFRISPLSFFQVNPRQTEKLYQKAIDLAQLTGNETVFDLYCGIGTIALSLAEKAKHVIGVEIVPQAVEDAEQNASLNGVDNVDFYIGAAETVVPELYRSEGVRADVVVVDPPRKGCDATLLETILQMHPERIVYVSCNPSTLARDLKLLCGSGYHLESVQAYDQFAQTVHVETVCLLSKLSKAKHHVTITLDMDEMDVTAAESKATYDEIREWVQEKYGFHVTNLNIAQVKRANGIIERENYNKPKSESSRQPGCPEEKIKAIEEALRFFQMI